MSQRGGQRDALTSRTTLGKHNGYVSPSRGGEVTTVRSTVSSPHDTFVLLRYIQSAPHRRHLAIIGDSEKENKKEEEEEGAANV